MAKQDKFGLDELVDLLKAAGEPTRLRLLALLAGGDLTVTDLMEILGQSQPRISRHLKLLTEENLVDRYQEGAWAYFRLRHEGRAALLVRQLLDAAVDGDAVLTRDSERLAEVKRVRAERAQLYFSRNASEWDMLRRLQVDDDAVESALVKLVGKTPVDALLDLGTGTGSILQLLDGVYRRATGIDASRDMLAVARSNLDRCGATRAVVRQGDILNLPLEGQDFDLVTIHQVLHFLDYPERAIAEAARMLRPGGRLVVIDLAPHSFEYLRNEHAHVRLGFSHQTMTEWLSKAGLDVEKIVDVVPDDPASDSDTADTGKNKRNSLAVTIWLARDMRLMIAGGSAAQDADISAGRA